MNRLKNLIETLPLLKDLNDEKLRDRLIQTVLLSCAKGIDTIVFLETFIYFLEKMIEEGRDVNWAVERFVSYWERVINN